ncbi:MAG: PAS domain S-box protein [Stenomitos rutilans HA7619-LM2]|jgi:hypothetical protein|nr:PAS domain S-box protein [Stenomitos rutilans HA7619-LM2]
MQGTASEPVATRKVHILVVEDESVIAADIKDCLENLGYAVPAIVVSGEAAVATATTVRPDLVLMDIRLKGDMDGVQAAAAIWTHLRIPVVYSTGHSDRSTMERAKATEPFGYVLKPIEEQELYVAIETALQRFRLERDLQEREQWLSSILKAIGDGVIVTDASSRVRFLNGAAEALTGWRQEEAIGKESAEIFCPIHEETRVPLPNPIHEALQTGQLVYLPDNTLLCSKNGRDVPISDSAAPFHNDSGNVTGVVLVFRDVTERRQAEERNRAIERSHQLEDQMVELQRLNQLKDDFLNTVSHELRTPLTNIKMAVRMLEVTLSRAEHAALTNDLDTNSTIRYLQILNDQCERQTSLINDLLDLQRLNADAYAIDISTIYLQTWLPNLATNFQERVFNQQQQLHVSLEPTLPPIMTDASSLNRVMSELLNNAVKYTPSGEHINVTVHLLECLPTTAPMLQIEVCNSGVEIPIAELPRIFDQFYRIPSVDRWRQGGTGLGLTLVKKLVERLNGSIQVTSTSLQTCFAIVLPVERLDTSTTSV